MKINEVERKVGITKKNIRFYEGQGLLTPSRNPENGYRNYSDVDVETLLKIKLLRKLAVPIEEIRKLQGNQLTIGECMQRHIIFLSHQEKNLVNMKEICQEISKNDEPFSSLDAPSYLLNMERMEKGGMRFMNIGQRDVQKKQGACLAAVAMIALMALLLALFIWGEMTDPLPIPLFAAVTLFPMAIIVGVILAARQRIKEIEGGEENEAAKY